MNGILTTFSIFTTSLLLGSTLAAADPTVQTLETRINGLESRVKELEAALKTQGNSFSYQNAATVEATNGVTVSKPAATTSGQTYVIQDGDTLGKIAGKFGIERKALLEANRLGEGQPIYIGETLMIPGSATQLPTEKITAPTPPATNNVAANTPAPAAPLAPPVPPVKQDNKVVGETKAPAPATTSTHTVAKGDTLTSLAKKYNTSVDSLKSANGLRSDTISLGQTLKIPSAKPTSTAAAGNTKAPASTPAVAGKPNQKSEFEYDNPLLNKSETYGYYTVVKGDNLYALARDFFTSMPELQRINNLGESTVIQPGQDIIVPTSKYNQYHKEEVANR